MTEERTIGGDPDTGVWRRSAEVREPRYGDWALRRTLKRHEGEDLPCLDDIADRKAQRAVERGSI